MLTGRGLWFLLFSLAMLAAGLRAQNTTLGVLSLTLVLWFFWQWLLFCLRVHGLAGRLHAARQVRDERGLVDNLWAGQSFQVNVQLQLRGPLGLPYVKVADRLPFAVDQVHGTTEREGAVSRGEPLELSYRFHCAAPGLVRFEGVSVQLADLQGFFYHATFLAEPRVLRVLPPLADARGHVPAVKRHNMLPLLGVHRHRRPGSGSELLDLRDYIPGDPPKTIAWKPSARRDKLMTKEFESEVPVRCTLFVDTSNSVRVGPPGRNALTRLVEIAAGVAQASAGARDLTGLCLFDEQGAAEVRPARGARHLVQLINRLADAAGKSPSTGEASMRPLLRVAYGLAMEVYPRLMRPDVNRSPWWLPWLWPQPLYTVGKPRKTDYVNHWLFLILLVLWGTALGWLVLGVERAFRANPWSLASWFWRAFFDLGLLAAAGAGFYVSLMLLRAYLLFMPVRRRLFHRRKRLAALLGAYYALGPGALGVLLEDDEHFIHYLQRFLSDHQVPYPVPLYDRRGRYLFAAPGKVEVLASALVRAVGKGHDNELFVLMADLLELEDHLAPLLRSVKVARGRHHEVLVICPWPPGILPPGEEPARRSPARDARAALKRKVLETTTSRFHRAYHQLRRTFARLGVHLLCAREGEPARLIRERIDQLRLAGKRR
jgi:uncharacterized protein (DUF58 family)